MIYPESRGDYFTKSWSQGQVDFENQLDILCDERYYIAVTDDGFVQLSLPERIVEYVKGLFGGTDYSQEERVRAAWLKFLYYAEAHECLKEKHIKQLRRRICYSPELMSTAIRKMFDELEDYHSRLSVGITRSKHLQRTRQIVVDYHTRHATSLQPGFWSRLISPPSLDPKKLFHFGDTPLQMSQQALEQVPPDPFLAFTYLKRAFEVKNNEGDFQEKLADQLEILEPHFTDFKDKQRQIQNLWIELAQSSFENNQKDVALKYLDRALTADSTYSRGRLTIGRLYLIHQEYALALPFLEELQKANSGDLETLIEIGHAYWDGGKDAEAVSTYEAALELYQEQDWKFEPVQKQIALVCSRLSEAYTEKLTDTDRAKGMKYAAEAVKNDSTHTEYQDHLCSLYQEEWEADSEQFLETIGNELVAVIKLLNPTIINQYSSLVAKMLMGASERHFKNHQNQKAHAGLNEALRLFPDQPELIAEILEMAVSYNDWSPLKSKFDEWEAKDYSNPLLKEKMGDAYWSVSRKTALKYYNDALQLFSEQVAVSNDDDEKKMCQEHMAQIKLKIAQSQLQTQPGLFSGVPYDDAIHHLEEAAKLDPKHMKPLFEAYLAAANAEKQRSMLLRNTKKIIDYYRKAFETLQQKGEYLIELLQLYLDSKQHDDAMKLYANLQKQPWSKNLTLPASAYSRLAEKFHEQKDHTATVECLKQAHTLEPKNQTYKQNYFQLVWVLAENQLGKIESDDPKVDERIKRLKNLLDDLLACWKIGFDQVDKMKESYQEMIAKVYRLIAYHTLSQALIPQAAEDYIDKKDIQAHLTAHQAQIKEALSFFNEGLRLHPNYAPLHFDKGVLLEYWMTDYENALKAYELAVKHQPRNPYYHKLLGSAHYTIHGDSGKNEEERELAEKYAPPAFTEDYLVWSKELLFKEKTKTIDPHAYTQKKRWFS